MYPRLHIGSFVFPSFLVLTVLGGMIAYAVFCRLARGFGLSWRHILGLGIGATLAGHLGAHWLHVLVAWEHYQHRPLTALLAWWDGRAFLGGPIGGSLFVLVYVWWYRLPGWKVFDAAGPMMVIAQIFGRLGCFASGCCHGIPTDGALGIVLPRPVSPREWTGLPLHPVQLYEAVGLLVLLHVLFWLRGRRWFDGRVVLGYWIGYGLLRFHLEFLRGDPIRGSVLDGLLSTSQFLCLLALAGAAIVLAGRLRQVLAGRRHRPGRGFPTRLREDGVFRGRVLWAGLAVLALVTQGPGLLRVLKPPLVQDQGQRDLFQEWASARNFREELPVYTPHVVSIPRYLGFSADPNWPYLIEFNAHPPTSVLLALPFASMGYREAHLCWNLLSLAALAIALAMLARQFSLPAWSVFPIVVVLSGEPLHEHLLQGQFGCLLLLLIVLCWRASRNDHERTAGLWLGLATAVKLFPGFLFVYFAARRQWRVVAHGLLWLVLLTLGTVFILGPDTYTDYLTVVLPRVGEWRSGWSVSSVAAFWAKLFHPGDRSMPAIPLIYSPVLALAGTLFNSAFLTLVVVQRARQARNEKEQEGAFGLALIATVLLSPISWNHYFFLMAPALIWLTLQLRPNSSGRLLLGFLLSLLWVSTQVFWILLGPQRGQGLSVQHTFTMSSFQLYALLVLFGFQALILRNISTVKHLAGEIGQTSAQDLKDQARSVARAA